MDGFSYSALFLSALVAATLLPAQSELVLSGLLIAGDQPAWVLIAVASAGNILGAVVNWGLGRFCHRFRDRPWFPVKAQALSKAEGWYRKYGQWSLLLSWAPVIGDPLTLASGLLREPFLPFLALVSIAKIGRYLVVAALVLPWL